MSVVKEVTFEGLKYNLDNKDRVAAFATGEGGIGIPVSAKTAAYTVTQADIGSLITNRGDADALTITLPADVANYKGAEINVLQVAGQLITIATATADTMLTTGDAAADSIVASAEAEAQLFRIFCDGTTWIVLGLGNTQASTNSINYTVTTD